SSRKRHALPRRLNASSTTEAESSTVARLPREATDHDASSASVSAECDEVNVSSDERVTTVDALGDQWNVEVAATCVGRLDVEVNSGSAFEAIDVGSKLMSGLATLVNTVPAPGEPAGLAITS